jgi:hypothetical protein
MSATKETRENPAILPLGVGRFGLLSLTDAESQNVSILGVARISRLPSSQEAELAVVADKYQL